MMRSPAGWAVVLFLCPLSAQTPPAAEPPGLLEKFLDRMRSELARMPDYVCTQQVERFSRARAEAPWEKDDALVLDVGLVGLKEIYSRPGERGYQDRSLMDLARKGTVSTGQFAMMARHVFVGQSAKMGYRGTSERNGRAAHEYEFDVAAASSAYQVRRGTESAVVPFQGSFHIDAETADLLELEVQAYDIPDKIALAQVDTRLTYTRVSIGSDSMLLPSAASLIVVGVDGIENMNRARMTGCRRFSSDTQLTFDEKVVTPAASTASAAAAAPSALPAGLLLELALETDIRADRVQEGDPIVARLSRNATLNDKTLLQSGTTVRGTVVRVHRETVPHPTLELGFEFDTVELDSGPITVGMTMLDAGPASGLLAQSRRMKPKYDRRARPGMTMLVREVQQGQGILVWDARKNALPRGLKMKWRVLGENAEDDKP